VLRAFRGHPGTPDDHFPEDWLASTVRARKGAESRGPDEGLSFVTVNGETVPIARLAIDNPEYFPNNLTALPENDPSFGVLLKLLDSADRLHIQAHPNDDFVRARFNAPHGKTECWYILETRSPDAYVHLGFQRPPSPRDWKSMIQEQRIDDLLACFDRIRVKPGDCFLVPAGVPHAIGAGVFMVELQQPSDWVVRCEFTVGGHTLPEASRFMGLTLDECMPIFDFSGYDHDAFRKMPHILRSGEGFVEEQVVDAPAFFKMRRLRGAGPATFENPSPGVLIVTNGCGTLSCGNDTPRNCSRGETILLPASDETFHWNSSGDPWEFLIASPPTKP
jgi:mannose-6-phosphate isomerase